MPMRWIILIVLFFARTVMALQFQSVAALSPFIMDSLAITLTDIGVLIGLYLGPGIVVAVVGGAMATWFGDKRTVIASLVLMVLGGLIVASATTLGWAVTGRIVSGIGGVVLNVLMTKFVIDWFAGRNVSTALAIYISSWPIGIALGLLVLPILATNRDLSLAWNSITGLAVLALVLFVWVYRPPESAGQVSASIKLAALPWPPLICAALLWGLYNAAFAMVFGFGTLVLVERGFAFAAASSAAGLYIFAITIGIPLGGWLADRSSNKTLVVNASLLAGAVLFPVVLFIPDAHVLVTLIVGGLIFGLAPGPIVSMPGRILPVQARAFGTGVFYSIYYALMMIAPVLAGAIADRTGDVRIVFLLGTIMMVLAMLSHAGFNRFASSSGAR